MEAACSSGIPEQLYFLRQFVGAADNSIPVDMAEVGDILRDTCKPPPRCESKDIEEHLDHVMVQRAEQQPHTADECVAPVPDTPWC